MTYGLIAANVAVYLLVTLPLSTQAPDAYDPLLREYLRALAERAHGPLPVRILEQISQYDLFVFRWGFRPAEPSLVALFSAMFLHGGFLHLFGNMLFLWIYGDNVEHRLGRVPYLLAYLGTGVAATLFHALFDADSNVPMVGASGAISGVLGFYFAWFPRNSVRLLVLFFPLLVDVVSVPARVLLGLYLVVDNLLPFLLSRGSGLGGVAYGAHIGGFLAGLTAAWWLERRAVVRAPSEYRRAAPPRTPREALQELVSGGDFAEAARLYFSFPPSETRRLLGPAGSLSLAKWLAANGHEEAALTVFRRHLRDYPEGPGAAEAHLGAGLLLLEAFGQPTAAYQHFLEALEFDPPPELEDQIRRAMAAVEALQKYRLRIGRRH
jgi:membrane associated rhomboid family serine protease